MTPRMRALVLLVVLATACGPSAQQLRTQRLAEARGEAQQRPGARQALAFAEAVHAAKEAGDYKAAPRQLVLDAGEAIRVIDLATPTAGVDTAMLVSWRAQMFFDLDRMNEALEEWRRSFAIAPTKHAGLVLVGYHGSRNEPHEVGRLCTAIVDAVSASSDKLSVIAECRRNMNAATPAGEMAWMSPELVTWYQAENARRLEAQIEYENQLAAQQREENRIVRRTEQCALDCKERGLRCQNRCHGDVDCENRCVEINHACVDRCESAAKEELGY